MNNEQLTVNNEQIAWSEEQGAGSKAKKKICSFFIVHCALLIFTLLSSCPAPFTQDAGEELPEGYGSFTLMVEGQRTILPPSDSLDNIAEYELDFYPVSGGEYKAVTVSAIPTTVALKTGTYNINLYGKLGVGSDKDVCEAYGELKNVVIGAGAAASGTITLKPLLDADGSNLGKGTFSYSVTISAAANVTSAQMAVTKDGAAISGSPFNLSNSGLSSSTMTLDIGMYNVRFTLVRNNNAQAVWAEILYVYRGLTSPYSITFDNDYFYRTHYTVTFEANGGSAVAAINNVNHGTTITAPTAPTKAGYGFGGWYKESSLTNPWNFTTDTVTAPITLYARWIGDESGLMFELIDTGNNANTYRVRNGTVTGGAVIIPANYDGKPVTEIGSASDSDGNGAFQNAAITGITIPNTVTTIGTYAFAGCAGLTGSIAIPVGVNTIGNYAFDGVGLTGINIPAGLTTIGNLTFINCARLEAITVDAGNPNYASEDGILYDKAKTSIRAVPAGITGEVNIPNGVTSINTGAFYGCAGLTSVSIPSSVTSIGGSVFSGCTGLTEIIIPNNVTTINGNYVFRGCTSLTSVTIPGSIYTTSANYWFEGCTSLTSVTFGLGFTRINNYMFQNCTSLANITIPNSVTYIGSNAFQNCTSLTSVTFAGTIADSEFNSTTPFPGDLRAKFYTDDPDNGTPGTYTVTSGTGNNKVWTKQ